MDLILNCPRRTGLCTNIVFNTSDLLGKAAAISSIWVAYLFLSRQYHVTLP